MKKRTLGQTNLEVAPIGLGTMGMDHGRGPQANRNDMIQLLQNAVDIGYTLFDTAFNYGAENEKLLGEAFKNIRNQVVISTKFGIIGQKIIDGQLHNILDSEPSSIKEQLDGSLQRLQTDTIDIFYQHRIDPNVEPEVVAHTMKEAIDSGKIRGWGVSNAPIEYIRRAHAVCPITATQNQYSMIWREPEKELFDLCEELGITFVAFSPLGNGFLSGKYSTTNQFGEGDFRNFMGRFKPEVIETNQELLNLLKHIASEKNATPAQIVLAWELAQKPYIIPIPGTTKLHRLKENFEAINIEFSKKELSEINTTLNEIEIDETHF